ncbi:MAG: zinc-binding alcohol dehydrogenase family protein [Proteobacteria bacterium]|nr:MAG: zinc-binding alcohol dehydrogenase family protein [Pseudomonadota bacterium]
MKAVAYQASHPIDHPDALIDTILPDPIAQGRDLLVEVRAVSVNPVDTKVRKGSQPENGAWKVLGWDAAAMPLTSLTAWEMLFDRLQVPMNVGGAESAAGEGRSLLIVGAAGGVGSIMVQLARKLTALTVIGTASRPESQEWVKKLGAHHVIDHSQPLSAELARVGAAAPDYIVSLTHTDQHYAEIVEAIAPQGRFGLIDDPEPIDVRQLKRKSVSLHWELMFTRSIFQTDDMQAQQDILSRISELVDAGTVASTATERFGVINAANLKRAHALLESGKARGKIVLAGF